MKYAIKKIWHRSTRRDLYHAVREVSLLRGLIRFWWPVMKAGWREREQDALDDIKFDKHYRATRTRYKMVQDD